MSVPSAWLAKAALAAIGAIFKKVFAASSETVRGMGPQLELAVSAISKIGAKRMKEILLAVPLLVLFVRELLRHREEMQAQKQLFIVGAAAALSTLGLIILGSMLGSLPLQLVLVFTHPWLGIPLLLSEKLTVAAVVILLVWLIIYALNFVLAEDPAYRRIRDGFFSTDTNALLLDIEKEVSKSGVDIDELRTVVTTQLKQRGAKTDPEKIDRRLARVARRVRARVDKRSAKMTTESETPDKDDSSA